MITSLHHTYFFRLLKNKVNLHYNKILISEGNETHKNALRIALSHAANELSFKKGTNISKTILSIVTGFKTALEFSGKQCKNIDEVIKLYGKYIQTLKEPIEVEDISEYLTTTQVMQMIGYKGKNKAYFLQNYSYGEKPKIPSIKQGQQRLFKPEDVKQYLNKSINRI